MSAAIDREAEGNLLGLDKGEKMFVRGLMKKPKMDEVAAKARSESAMLAANKSSHVISKSRRSSKYSKHKIISTPTIRVVYVYEPETIKTDPQNFRSLVQKLTGKPIHKSKEKKRKTNPRSPSPEVACAKVGTEDDQDAFYSNDLMPIMENESTNFSIEDCSGFSNAFNKTDKFFPGPVNQGLLHENPVVWNNVQDTFYSNDQMPIMENKITNFSMEDFSGFSEAFNDTDMVFSDLVNQGLLHENPLVWNNSLFCNMYDETGVYNGLEDW